MKKAYPGLKSKLNYIRKPKKDGYWRKSMNNMYAAKDETRVHAKADDALSTISKTS